MSYQPRQFAPHVRSQSSSMGGSQSTGQPSPALVARIEEKKAELAALKDLQTLSAGLADQMQTLADKLATLSDGTEAVAAVLSNWKNVTTAITLASTKLSAPKEGEDADNDVLLPQTLVRIPTQIPPTSEGAE